LEGGFWFGVKSRGLLAAEPRDSEVDGTVEPGQKTRAFPNSLEYQVAGEHERQRTANGGQPAKRSLVAVAGERLEATADSKNCCRK